MLLLSLASVLLLASSSLASNQCLDSSWAISPVTLLSRSRNLERGQNFQSALNVLWPIYSTSTSPFAIQLYYGLDNDNFYSIFDCYSVYFKGAPVCRNSSRYVMGVRNNVSFPDNHLHYYKTNDNGYIQGASYFASATEYFPTARPWFVDSVGWTDTYISYTSGVQGQTYHVPFEGGVAGGDRVLMEPCTPPLIAAFQPIFADYWAAHQSGGEQLATLPDIIDYAKEMIAAIKGYTPEVFVEAFIGFENGDFYDIGDCRHWTQLCLSPGYILYARNPVVFGSESLVSVHLNLDGSYDGNPVLGDPYDPRERPWYIQQDGWAIYTSTTINNVVCSYSASLKGGVAAAESVPDAFGNCRGGRDPFWAFPNYSGAERSVVPSVLAAVLALCAAVVVF